MHLPCGRLAPAVRVPCMHHAFTIRLPCSGRSPIPRTCHAIASRRAYNYHAPTMRLVALANDLPCIYHAARRPSPRMCHALASPSPRSGLSPQTYHAFTMRAPRAGHAAIMHIPCVYHAFAPLWPVASDLPCTYHAGASRRPCIYHASALRLAVPCPWVTMHLPCGSLALASDLPCFYHAARRPWPLRLAVTTSRRCVCRPSLRCPLHLPCCGLVLVILLGAFRASVVAVAIIAYARLRKTEGRLHHRDWHGDRNRGAENLGDGW